MVLCSNGTRWVATRGSTRPATSQREARPCLRENTVLLPVDFCHGDIRWQKSIAVLKVRILNFLRVSWRNMHFSLILFGSVYLSCRPSSSPGHASPGGFCATSILSEVGVWTACCCPSSGPSSFTVVMAQRGLRTMYLYFFQLQAFGSELSLVSLCVEEKKHDRICKTKIWLTC